MGAKHGTWAVELKSGSVPKVGKGFAISREDIQPSKAFVVYGRIARYAKARNLLLGLYAFCRTAADSPSEPAGCLRFAA
jgi:hypothetical protein